MKNSVKLVNLHETDSKIPYMMQDGKKMYLANSSDMFLNTASLFVEYIDIIKSPYIGYLQLLAQEPQNFDKYFDVKRLAGLDLTEVSEWYVRRRYQNPFKSLLKEEYRDKITDDDLDGIVDAISPKVPELIYDSPELNFVNTIRALHIGNNSIVKKLFIWYPGENEIIRDDIHKTLDNAIVVTGNIVEATKDVPENSTYVFSDITNVSALQDIGKLYLSSVVIASEYRYNYNEDEELKVNYDEYLKETMFKMNLFNACTILVESEDEEED